MNPFDASREGIFTGRIKLKFASEGQRNFAEVVRNTRIVVCKGVAGTGKTLLAVALACEAARQSKVAKIIFTRPLIEADAGMGYLPGPIADKTEPYMQPMVEALSHIHTLSGENKTEGSQPTKNMYNIEIIPLSFMRGRTFRNSFVVVDEAQNMTGKQLYMVLSRLDSNSRCVILGDPDQIDIPRENSGLLEVYDEVRSQDLVHMKSVELTDKDAVRSIMLEEINKVFRSIRCRKMNSSCSPTPSTPRSTG